MKTLKCPTKLEEKLTYSRNRKKKLTFSTELVNNVKGLTQTRERLKCTKQLVKNLTCPTNARKTLTWRSKPGKNLLCSRKTSKEIVCAMQTGKKMEYSMKPSGEVSCCRGLLHPSGHPGSREMVTNFSGRKYEENSHVASSYVPLMISKHKGLQEKESNCLQVGKDPTRSRERTVSDNHSPRYLTKKIFHGNEAMCTMRDIKSSNMTGALQKELRSCIYPEQTSRAIKRKQSDNNDHYTKKARREKVKPEQTLMKENGSNVFGINISSKRTCGENKGPKPFHGLSNIHQFLPHCTSSRQNPPGLQNSGLGHRPPESQCSGQKFSTSTSYHSVPNRTPCVSHHPGPAHHLPFRYHQPATLDQKFSKSFPAPSPGIQRSIKQDLTRAAVPHSHPRRLEVSLPITAKQREEKENMKKKAQLERENACQYTSLGKLQFFVQREKDHEIARAYGYPEYLLDVVRSYLESE
ncbi:uncharacterized protein LOC115094454 isoform X2 [Rhinatrema bivittatum]|nr:uncharacterized protein LOC115094454 isoform X2 [Rhinatrema bivittatum]